MKSIILLLLHNNYVPAGVSSTLGTVASAHRMIHLALMDCFQLDESGEHLTVWWPYHVINHCFLYFRLILRVLSLSCFLFRLLVNSSDAVECIPKLFSIDVVQPGPNWMRNAAAMERC